jgi:glutamine synthetase
MGESPKNRLAYSNKIYEIKRELEKSLVEKDKITDCAKLSTYLKDNVLTKMEALRTVIDEIELIVDKDYWPFVSYGDLLYSVK